MSIRVDSSPLIAGSLIVGDTGLGVLAEDIPSTGENGGSFLYNDLDLPADNGKEIRGLITTEPANASSFFVYEDGSFEYTGPSDSFQYQLYVDGVAVGSPETVTLSVGATNVTASHASVNVTTYQATVTQPGAATNISATHASVSVATYQADVSLGTITNISASSASVSVSTYPTIISATIPTNISASHAAVTVTTYSATVTVSTGVFMQPSILVYVVRAGTVNGHTNPGLLIHDGNGPVSTPAMDPDADQWRGYTYPLITDETITNSQWLIDDVIVTPGQTVNGITFLSSQYSGDTTKARITCTDSVTIGSEHRLTNRLSTNVVPSDDRTMTFIIKEQ